MPADAARCRRRLALRSPELSVRLRGSALHEGTISSGSGERARSRPCSPRPRCYWNEPDRRTTRPPRTKGMIPAAAAESGLATIWVGGGADGLPRPHLRRAGQLRGVWHAVDSQGTRDGDRGQRPVGRRVRPARACLFLCPCLTLAPAGVATVSRPGTERGSGRGTHGNEGKRRSLSAGTRRRGTRAAAWPRRSTAPGAAMPPCRRPAASRGTDPRRRSSPCPRGSGATR